MSPFPKAPGTYILFLRLSAPRSISIGRLGAFDFPVGVYAYVGSAFGPGGLQGRLKHHLAPVVKAHWHIDYLRAIAPCFAVSYLADLTRYEHQWAEDLAALPIVSLPVPRFGASDCCCESHLFHFHPAQVPDVQALQHTLNLALLHYVLP